LKKLKAGIVNNERKNSILVTFDSMKFLNTGLFHFGKSIGNALMKQNQGEFDLNYYLEKSSSVYFEGKFNPIYRSKLHKLFFPKYNRFDLVHFSDQYCRLKPQKLRGKKILTIHDINQVHEKYFDKKKLDKYLTRLQGYIAACDRVVTISNFVANDVLTHFPGAAGKISVIYNGADKLYLPEKHLPTYLPKKPFLFTIGILSSKKNFHVLPSLLHGNDFELVISGIETQYKDKIIEEAKRHGCQNRVIITGPVSEADKAWYYKNCDGFVFPSIAEGFGLPVIEAMHFGKPVFLSKYTSLPEIGGDKAYYFDNFEPHDMQNILLNGLDDFRQKNKSASLIAYADRFNWDTTAQQYLALYRECLS
jgi:glycosyltransferase involved in cell wall biosynthesis